MDPQIFGSDINVGTERISTFGASAASDRSECSERLISHAAFELKKIRERSDHRATKEQPPPSSYSGCDLWLCRFFSFRLSFPVRFSIHNFNYRVTAAFSECSAGCVWKGRRFPIMFKNYVD